MSFAIIVKAAPGISSTGHVFPARSAYLKGTNGIKLFERYQDAAAEAKRLDKQHNGPYAICRHSYIVQAINEPAVAGVAILGA